MARRAGAPPERPGRGARAQRTAPSAATSGITSGATPGATPGAKRGTRSSARPATTSAAASATPSATPSAATSAADPTAAHPPATATDRVYEGIYRAVLERRLAAGAWLREEELAASFGVSRTVVRQALQRLAQHQVVELIHNRGARVPLPELADAEHVFEARRVAECEIARRLGGRLGPAQLAELQGLVDEEERAAREGDTPRAVRLSGEFHQALARLHGNPVLERLLDSLLPTTSVLMSRFATRGQPACVAHRHIEVLQALARGGPEAAGEMRRHLAELQRALTRADDTPARPLRDVFAGYREALREEVLHRRTPRGPGEGEPPEPAEPRQAPRPARRIRR